ncbi:MAG: alpha-1,4-glucan--maltose-1-phosphate maltosyltransferase [Verrucomicrobia bacterium]|nr:alpha-1,4-glucan--maltose-1-phosphate maltosyltransferase [Verrucomicrobiota bacterium]
MAEHPPSPIPAEGRRRVVVSNVSPELDGGRFAIKRTVDETVAVEADILADGHDQLAAVLLYRGEGDEAWSEAAMAPLGNDRWRGWFRVTRLGMCRYTVRAWVDHFRSWQRDLGTKHQAGQDLTVDLLAGAQMVEAAARRAGEGGATQLAAWAEVLAGRAPAPWETRLELALSAPLADMMGRHPDRGLATTYDKELRVVVDPPLARFGAWYELFPRSLGQGGRHGTFKDVEAHLPRIAAMGFDVLYFPPIHPIGRAFRKGKNNNPACLPGEPGSPWGIGSAEGGHKTIHPELGTLEDFRQLVRRARAMRIEIALDIAFQCAPDHPYVKEHPEWFRKRPDGSIQYAENPPKRYQDIYPFDFETEAWEGLWRELKSVFEFWIEQGVTVFRVDNPHTKAFAFWEWCLAELKRARPELIFLAEAFTRPKVMYRLAKLGFTQSYNYFPWRNTKHELTEYFTELTRSDPREFLRPNLWPNTPDILTQYLQYGGRPAFMVRLVLAATLGASYGIYGPAFELCLNQAREPGSEEYLDSEKYEIKTWDLETPGNLADLVQRVNRIRRDNPALQDNGGLRFHAVDNEQLIAYTKSTADRTNIILVVANLDPHHVQRGWLELPLDDFDVPDAGSCQMHDLLTDARYLWQGGRHYVELDPRFSPAHVFRLRQRVRTEQDFDYYL